MSMLELIDNLLQIAILGTVTVLSVWWGMGKAPRKELFHFSKVTLCGFLGDLFWTLYFVIYGEFPAYFSSADLCFIGMYLSLVGLSILFYRERPHGPVSSKAVVCGVVTAFFVFIINAITYWLVGGFWWTVAYALPLMVLGYVSARNARVFWEAEKQSPTFQFHMTVVSFVVVNHMMFLVSSFGWNNLYIFFDFGFTFSIPVMLYWLWKGDAV